MTDERRRRQELRQGLEKTLGGDVADNLMGELPPDGWESLARQEDLVEVKFDIIALRSDLEDLKTDVAGLKSDVAVLRKDVEVIHRDISRLQGSMRFLVGSVVTVSVAMIALLVQINLTVASLR